MSDQRDESQHHPTFPVTANQWPWPAGAKAPQHEVDPDHEPDERDPICPHCGANRFANPSGEAMAHCWRCGYVDPPTNVGAVSDTIAEPSEDPTNVPAEPAPPLTVDELRSQLAEAIEREDAEKATTPPASSTFLGSAFPRSAD